MYLGKQKSKKKVILYLGFNSFREHKRGVENVIEFQSKAFNFDRIYYLHWGSDTSVYKNNKFVCISIKHCWYWPLILNLVLVKLRIKNKFIIHSHNPLFSFCSVLKTNILTVHDGLYYLSKSKKNKFTFLARIIEFLVYFRCSKVHFISKYTKEQSLFGKRNNFLIIPNTSHFEQLAPNFNVKNKNNGSKNVLIVRSIEERARIDLLLQIAEKLHEDDYMFTVAGKGPLLVYYQKEIQERKLKNIEMLGFVNDEELLYLYANCDIVLMIAEYGEGFGLPIIEGYLFNKPVIASNKCAIPEVIISKDYLFENIPESIITSLEYISSIQNENYSDYYKSRFSNSMVLSMLENLYLNVLS